MIKVYHTSISFHTLRNVTGKIREINHINNWDAKGAFAPIVTGDNEYQGTSAGSNYGNRDFVEALFSAKQDIGEYGNPMAGHTDNEIRPYSIYALPLIAY